MAQTPSQIPAVLVFAGLDPTGGAGLQADIEAIASMGCHAAPIATTLTAQDTHAVRSSRPVDALHLVEQARMLLDDVPVAACKIGLLGSVAVVEAIHTLLAERPTLATVLDPVLASGNGRALTDAHVVEAMKALLLPLATVITPNSLEARALAPEADTLDAAGQALLAHGCEFVLITGTHEVGAEVVNTLYGGMRRLETFHWERLPHSYHGSGCTLSSAIAGLLAQGREPFSAIHEAQQYTWETLRAGYRVGGGQHIPNRLFWAREDESH